MAKKKATVEDVIDALQDAMDAATALTIDEVDARDGKQAAVKAINEIRAGLLADAITTLEHEFLPRWNDKADCEAAYRAAMGRKTA